MRAHSSIVPGGTETFSFDGNVGPLECIFMAPFALQNAYLWLRLPSLMRGHQDTFSPYGGTHDEAPKRKDIAPFAL